MTFEEAVTALKGGSRIRRKQWRGMDGTYVFIIDESHPDFKLRKIMGSRICIAWVSVLGSKPCTQAMQWTDEMVFADDWEVIG